MIKTKIGGFLERFFTHGLPHGTNVLYDIRKEFPTYQPRVFFDVGAHLGQSAKRILYWFPKARVYCFEPVNSTFVQLKENLSGRKNISTFRLAFASTNGSRDIILRKAAGLNSFLFFPEEFPEGRAQDTETVETRTLSSFCHEEKINKIDFLKVDTEGYDFEVLKGAEPMLDLHQISFVQVEAGMNPLNKKHIPLEKFKEYLEAKRYFLFGVYEQTGEKSNPSLRRCNAVFVSEEL